MLCKRKSLWRFFGMDRSKVQQLSWLYRCTLSSHFLTPKQSTWRLPTCSTCPEWLAGQLNTRLKIMKKMGITPQTPFLEIACPLRFRKGGFLHQSKQNKKDRNLLRSVRSTSPLRTGLSVSKSKPSISKTT